MTHCPQSRCEPSLNWDGVVRVAAFAARVATAYPTRRSGRRHPCKTGGLRAARTKAFRLVGRCESRRQTITTSSLTLPAASTAMLFRLTPDGA